jgi:alcohol dehydrogenase class IV
MLTKHLLKISLLLPLVAISATARAGSTITDKSYWPNEARQSANSVTMPQNAPSSAFASTVMTPRFPAGPMSDEGENVRRYHGGPKGR